MAFAETVAILDPATDDALKTWAAVSGTPAGELLLVVIRCGLEGHGAGVPHWVVEIAREHDDVKRLLLVEGARRPRKIEGES